MHRPGKGLSHNPKRNDNGNTDVDGGPGGQIGGEDTKIRELCGPGVSGESKVNVGLTQGSALSPLLFIAVVELISRKICI